MINKISLVLASLLVVVGLAGCDDAKPQDNGWRGIPGWVLLMQQGDRIQYVKDQPHGLCFAEYCTGTACAFTLVPCEKLEPQKTATSAVPSASAR